MLGPSGWNQDLSLFKYFQFGEHVRLRFSADFFNALQSSERLRAECDHRSDRSEPSAESSAHHSARSEVGVVAED